MKRKKFIKKFSNILIASGFSPTILSCFGEEKNKIKGLKNWAGNYQYKASEVRFPKTISELSKNLKGLSKVKALGTQHCFNDIADTSGVQLSTRHLNSVIELNEKDSYVIDQSLMRQAKTQMIVMHPLPRLDEIAKEVDQDPRAAYFRQMKYGMYMRMAILSKFMMKIRFTH